MLERKEAIIINHCHFHCFLIYCQTHHTERRVDPYQGLLLVEAALFLEQRLLPSTKLRVKRERQ